MTTSTTFDIAQGLRNNEFLVNYEPLINYDETRYLLMCILWQHPRQGLLQQEIFLQEAQTQGMLIPLIGWALQNACQEVHQWRLQGTVDPSVQLNVPLNVTLLLAPNLYEMVAQALEESGLPARDLVLEVPLSAVETAMAKGILLLQKLQEQLGVTVALNPER